MLHLPLFGGSSNGATSFEKLSKRVDAPVFVTVPDRLALPQPEFGAVVGHHRNGVVLAALFRDKQLQLLLHLDTFAPTGRPQERDRFRWLWYLLHRPEKLLPILYLAIGIEECSTLSHEINVQWK